MGAFFPDIEHLPYIDINSKQDIEVHYKCLLKLGSFNIKWWQLLHDIVLLVWYPLWKTLLYWKPWNCILYYTRDPLQTRLGY